MIIYAPVNMEYKGIYLFDFGSISHLLYISWLFAERASVAATGLPASSQDGNTKSGRGTEGGRGSRKK